MLGLSYTFVTPGTSPTFFNNITTVFINRKDKSPVSQYAINSSSLPARFLWPWWLHKHQIMAGSNAHQVCLRFSSDKREWENTLKVVIISLLISISFIISSQGLVHGIHWMNKWAKAPVKAPMMPTWEDSVKELRTQSIGSRKEACARADGEVYIKL